MVREDTPQNAAKENMGAITSLGHAHAQSSDSATPPHGLQPTRLLCPGDFPGKSTGVGCYFLLQGIFLTQRWNLCLLHWQADSLPSRHLGSSRFSRQEDWCGLPFPSPEDLPDPGVEPRPPAWQADALPSEPPGKPKPVLNATSSRRLSLPW